MRKPLPRVDARTADNGKVRMGAGFGYRDLPKSNAESKIRKIIRKD